MLYIIFYKIFLLTAKFIQFLNKIIHWILPWNPLNTILIVAQKKHIPHKQIVHFLPHFVYLAKESIDI